MTLWEFKRIIVDVLSTQERARREKKRFIKTPIAAAQSTASAIDCDTSTNYITTNKVVAFLSVVLNITIAVVDQSQP
ncbi:hypothetical protein PF011_g4680 [Phytophthora fragariae]|uniref:Uncharacterized protein n=1 Tax=Phytophthora fragariae TaxID=53985 RepID=A0A6A3LR06_9STRA|nr:hypothetical protein PF011_g4680 [Phytophthora fragariae]